MQTHFERDLGQLKTMLLEMASHAETAVRSAIRSLEQRDDELARQTILDDSVLDRYEMRVDDTSIQLLARAPLASDLRLITVAMKISRDLERVGDEATTIARRSVELNREPQLKPYVDIPRMASMGLEMLSDALDAFVSGDPVKAREIVPRDKDVDALNKQLHRELASYMIESPATITRCLNLMVISKSLERIADHAANVAEDVVFLFEGRDIRHAESIQQAAKAAD